MSTLWQDLRYSIRSLIKSPGFTIVVIVTLAIGIGANTAIFSYLDGVLLKPLPYPEPERLVMVWEKPPGGERNGISTMNFLDWKKQNTVFENMAAATGGGRTLTGVDEPVRLRGMRVSASYFQIFGIQPMMGRTFAPDEDQPGKERVVVLSHRVWQSRFGGDRTIVGRNIGLDGVPHTVIGVLPQESSFDRGFFEIWLPLAFRPQEMTRDFHWMRSFARLKRGVTIEAARAEMNSIGANIEREYPLSNKGWGVTVDRMDERVVGSQLRQSLLVLMAAVGAVLLIGCANIANLLLARGSARAREVSIRSSLGAGRWRLIRQFLTESLLLSTTGAVFGVGLGWVMMIGLKAMTPPFSLPSEANVTLDGRALLFTFSVAIVTGILFGIAPAFQGTRTDLAMSLREGGRSSSGAAGGKRIRALLVMTEMALAFVLLTGAGLLIRSFFALQNVDPGFETTNVLTMGFPVADTKFPTAEQVVEYQNRVVNELSVVPGVREVALTSALPLQGWGYGMPYLVAGKPVVDRANRRACFFKMVSPSYFAALGIRVRKGRFLSQLDQKSAVPVTVINETMAKRDFLNEEPIGKRILVQQIVPGKPELGAEIPWEIVGVIADEKVTGLDDTRSAGMYVPLAQSPNFNTDIIIRGSIPPATLIKSAQGAVRNIDKDQALINVRTLEEIKDESVANNRLRTTLLTGFAAIALALSAVGIYGVVSYSVVQRTHELGIRAALGATMGNLTGLVIRNAMTVSLIGLLVGVAGAYVASQSLATLLFGVERNDPLTLISVGVLLASIALIACYVPARRVTKRDPVQALRYE